MFIRCVIFQYFAFSDLRNYYDQQYEQCGQMYFHCDIDKLSNYYNIKRFEQTVLGVQFSRQNEACGTDEVSLSWASGVKPGMASQDILKAWNAINPLFALLVSWICIIFVGYFEILVIVFMEYMYNFCLFPASAQFGLITCVIVLSLGIIFGNQWERKGFQKSSFQ